MRNVRKVIWGIALLCLGVLLGVRVFGVDVDVFFDGWWTLFMIIPGVVGLITERDKMGNAILLGIGVLLLLAAQDVISFGDVWKIGAPVVIILIAIKMIISGIRKKNNDGEPKLENINSDDKITTTAIFGGRELSFAGQPFKGGEFVAVFGGVDCDLRDAIIEQDCHVNAVAIFGGVDIIAPKGVNVKVKSVSIFGGTADTCEKDPTAPVTVYIDTVSIFGGVDIK